MTFDSKKIYELLPAIYRIRDDEQGKPLEALISIISEQAVIVQNNVDELYDNWFIETCREWVVPYIGDLLGVQSLNPISDTAGVSQRAYLANTIAYRRRKGIAPVLEQLTLDVTGWRAHVEEFFELLQTSQHMNHIRLHRSLTPDLRRMDELDRIDTAFDTVVHSADVRHISSGRGLHNISNLGIFVWRLQSYPLTRCEARRHECIVGSFGSPPLSPPTSPPTPLVVFTFNPTGKETQLFNRPQTELAITHISTDRNVPGLLRRRKLFDELEALRAAFESGSPRIDEFFKSSSEDESVFEIIRLYNDDSEELILPEEIMICNLDHCCTPPGIIDFKEMKEDGSLVNRKIKALADPVTGRFMFTEQDPDARALVKYSYGFSGDIGGGPYNRQDSIPKAFFKIEEADQVWQVGVSKTIKSVHGENICKTFNEAIAEWNTMPAGSVGIITILDSRTYEENLDIDIKEKSKLLIVAADWPIRKDIVDESDIRNAGDLLAENIRPFLLGAITITGHGQVDAQDTCGEITINGLLIAGKVSVLDGQLGAFNLIHSTIIPEGGGLGIDALVANTPSNRWLVIDIQRSISGSISLDKTAAIKLRIQDSILDKGVHTHAINAAETPVVLNCVTLFGESEVKTLEASDCIFDGIVTVKRRQEGCVRFSFVPLDSKAPRLYRCQPSLEISNMIAADTEKKGAALSLTAKEKIRGEVQAWLVPSFTSVIYDHYAYAQLSARCPVQITSGADNGCEMGAFNFLKQPQRRANLQIALNEYLPLGLEAGVIYVT